MTREAWETLIFKEMDDELTAEEKAELLRLKDDDGFQALRREIHAQWDILKDSRYEPSEALGARLAQRLVSKKKTYWRPVFAGLALAAVAVLAFFLGRNERPPVINSDPNGDVQTAGFETTGLELELARAQAAFKSAIGRLETTALEQLEKMPEAEVQEYETALALVEQAIRSSEILVDRYPDDYQAYAALSRAYNTKVELLNRIVDREGGA